MPLLPGARLGAYEIQSLIGAGGMGEVYRARDPKLDRLVAIKVLPSAASTEDLLGRFEREARAVAALNHPNILGIYDFGREGGHAFAVMELLEGETLRERLKAGPMAPRKAIDLARQLAEGLAAAHEKGIVHRDVKPDNIFLTKAGQVKVLDFGLTKQVAPRTRLEGNASALQTDLVNLDRPVDTLAGIVMGTVGYMSPEQVRGQVVDQRADIFAFGVVLYEMLTGRQAFRKDTAVGTMAAIMEEDPAELTGTRTLIPPALERLVLHCLEKDPGHRFQSMRDLAYDLANLSTLSGAAGPLEPRRRKGWPRAAGAAAVLLLGLALGVGAGFLRSGAQPPTFKRLSFVPGTVEAARFGADGRTVYFSQRVGGGRPDLFVLHSGDAEPAALGIRDALLLGVSASNELALLRNPQITIAGQRRGMLAQVAGGGGAPQDLQENVLNAVWDGEGLATLTLGLDDQFRLDFPAGRKLLSGNGSTRFLQHLRLSRDAARLALVTSDSGSKVEIALYDRQGHCQILYTKPGDSTGQTLTGLAWGPGGDLWYTERQEDQTALWAMAMGGQRRVLWRGPGAYDLLDVSLEGRALMAQHQTRWGTLAQRAGEPWARDLSILGNTQAEGLTADGRSVLLLESPVVDGGTARDEAYLRPLDGGPALKLGKGVPLALSPDGRWVHLDTVALEARDLHPQWATALEEAGMAPGDLADPNARNRFLLFVPTGLGRPFAIALPKGYENFRNPAFLLSDNQSAVCSLVAQGKDQWVLLSRKGAAARVLTREGFGSVYASLNPLSPDGTRLIVAGSDGAWFIQPLSGGDPAPIKGLLAGERILDWSADGKALYLRPELSVLPVAITRLELGTGARKAVKALSLPDPAGHLQTRTVFMAPDARAFVFSYEKRLSELYLVEGLK